MSERIPPKGRRAAKAAPVRSDGARTGSARATDRSRRASAGRDSPAPGAISAAPHPVGPRRERYLVAALRPVPGVVGRNGPWQPGHGQPGNGLAGPPAPRGAAAWTAEPAGAEELLTYLRADPSCVIHRVIAPSGPQFPPVAVVDMDADRAAMLALSGPMLHVEPDLPLQYGRAAVTRGLSFADPGVMPHGEGQSVVITVVGGDGKALDDADVYLLGEAFPVRGSTDAAGTVALELPASPVRGLYVRPRSDHWAVWLGRPDLSPDRPNLVSCPAFAETFPGFPERQLDGWAARALRLDSVPPTFRGHGVRIAILDSGAAAEHPDLTGRLAGGWAPEAAQTGDRDTHQPSWAVDTVGNGSHSAGIIGGSDNGHGVLGVVPEAEIYVGRLFPGGRFSDLIDALDYCVANQIDLVDLGLCSPQPSELLARKIGQLRQAGIACVAAAGNSGGPVSFPASLPSVLAVAAIGKTGEYSPESYHATQVHGVPTPEGYFSAAFTCFGPEIDVCAPGVAVVSSVPTTNYAALDGTSSAAAYVSGFAALLLAHHVEFRNRFRARDALRVDRLFELIRSSCRPVRLGDAGRAGAGLPDAALAFGLEPPPDFAIAGLSAATPPANRTSHSGPASNGAQRGNAQTGNGAAFRAGADDVMAPLRAALSAAGLLPMASGVAVESERG
jgi:subtilisin